MAVIENHQIKATVNHTLRYGASDKIAEKKAEEIMRDILHEDIPGTNLAVYKTLTVSLNQTKDTLLSFGGLFGDVFITLFEGTFGLKERDGQTKWRLSCKITELHKGRNVQLCLMLP